VSAKLNCWQYKNCGREKGGIMVDILGECPIPSAMKYDGHNDGIGAGRVCWIVPDTSCRLNNQFRNGQIKQCYNCEFYQRVVFEEDENVRFQYATKETTKT